MGKGGLLAGLKKESLNGLKSAEKELTDEELAELREEVSDAIDGDKIVTDADAKREIEIAMIESEKVTIPEDSPLKKKRKKDGTEIKTKKKPAKKDKTKPKAKPSEKKKLPKKEDKPKKTAKKIVIKGNKTETETVKSDFLPSEVPLVLPLEKAKIEPAQEYQMVHYKAPTPQLAKNFPSLEEITFLITRFKYVMDQLIDETDIVVIKGNEHICKSGWRKCIRAFNISIELVSEQVFEKYGDTHAKVIVRAILPTGQSVEGIGLKSYKDMFTDRNLHNLVSTAWTRAVNRAVSDLVGSGAVSAEEFPSNVTKGLFKD